MKIILASIVAFLSLAFSASTFAQPKSFKLNHEGDTLNLVDNKGLKQGKWVMTYPELRGNPGYDEEGIYKNDQKHGYWRKYSKEGDLIAVEHYIHGGKDGLQQYFSFLGGLLVEENWRGYNPDQPYDTIPVYGTGSNEVVDFKIVKAEPYSVKHGTWKYYEEGTGRLVKTEEYDRNNLVVPKEEKPVIAQSDKPKKVEKTAEMIEWEKKNSGKKKALRDGATGL